MKNFTINELCDLIDDLLKFSNDDVLKYNNLLYGKDLRVGIYPISGSPNTINVCDNTFNMVAGKLAVIDDKSLRTLYVMLELRNSFLNLGIIPPPPPPPPPPSGD